MSILEGKSKIFLLCKSCNKVIYLLFVHYASESLGLELQMAVSCCMIAGN